MPIPQLRRTRLAGIVLSALLVSFPDFAAQPGAASPRPTPIGTMSESNQQSRITSVSISGSEPAGTFGGLAYRRVWGHVYGLVAERDSIFGFDQLPHGADGNYGYESEFEIVAPEKPGTNSAIVIEGTGRV